MMYENRLDAGSKLARLISINCKEPVVYGLPRGGIIVAEPIAKKLKVKVRGLPVRKLPIPSDPEAGFGAICIDKTTYIDRDIVRYVGLSGKKIKEIEKDVLAEIKRRVEKYGLDLNPNLKGKCVVLVDDGIASGATMIASILFVAKRQPKKIIVMAPVASSEGFRKVKEILDQTGVDSEIIIPYVSYAPYFAVANYYKTFEEVEDEQVKKILG